MIRRVLVAALAAAFLTTAGTVPALSQSDKSEKSEKSEKKTKKLTAQQQKMKDCAAKWKDYKAQKNVKGREAYNKYMSECLKS